MRFGGNVERFNGTRKPFTLIVNGKPRHYSSEGKFQRDYRFFSRFSEVEAWDNEDRMEVTGLMPTEPRRDKRMLCTYDDLATAWDYEN